VWRDDTLGGEGNFGGGGGGSGGGGGGGGSEGGSEQELPFGMRVKFNTS
jgi:hypothetical protein